MVRGSVVLVKYLKLIFEYVICCTIKVRSIVGPVSQVIHYALFQNQILK